MTDNTTSSGARGSNSGANSQQNQTPVAEGFNLRGGLAEGYDQASDKAKARVIDQIEVRDSRMDKRREQQTFWRAKNIADEQNKLFKEHLSQPSFAPETPEAARLVEQTIAEQAEKNVDARDKYALQVIERECANNIKEILRLDQQEQLQNHGSYHFNQHAAPEHEQEHE